MSLPAHLVELRDRIEGYARDYGLDFYETIFESVTFDQMNMIASYGGFPTRYPHWKFGMDYEQLAKSYEYGLSKIYELVINTDPSYAYLLSSNADIDQKLVMAHVYGHVDFFKNNFMFAHTNRKMMDTMANHGTKIRRYIDRFGLDRVEGFVDQCLSIENLIDIQNIHVSRQEIRKLDQEDAPADESVPQLKSEREYMRGYINPTEFVEEQKRRQQQAREKEKRFPESPQRDILWFLMQYAPLENWQRDILGIIRDEAYYFSPQAQTKIMNEGWASYWHTTILTQKALEDSELIDYADIHSGTMGVQPGSINPYKLGIELFRDIEDRWDKGRFGKEWEECDSMTVKREWDTGAGKGREKIFEVRRHYNDITFIDEFLTPDFIREQKMFNYGYNQKTGDWEITDRDAKAIKEKLLTQLTNMGQPMIDVIDGNFENRGELLLNHRYQGVDLRDDHMRDTMQNLQKIWSRPVNLQTQRKEKLTLVHFDGSDFSEKALDTPL